MNSFYNVAGSTETYQEGLELAKKEGYIYLFRWINSDLSWTFFAKDYKEAYEQAIELYMQEKKESIKELAEECYYEFIDIIEIDEEIKSV